MKLPRSVIRYASDGTPYRYRPSANVPDRFIDGKPEPPMPNAAEAWRRLARWREQLALPGLGR